MTAEENNQNADSINENTGAGQSVEAGGPPPRAPALVPCPPLIEMPIVFRTTLALMPPVMKKNYLHLLKQQGFDVSVNLDGDTSHPEIAFPTPLRIQRVARARADEAEEEKDEDAVVDQDAVEAARLALIKKRTEELVVKELTGDYFEKVLWPKQKFITTEAQLDWGKRIAKDWYEHCLLTVKCSLGWWKNDVNITPEVVDQYLQEKWNEIKYAQIYQTMNNKRNQRQNQVCREMQCK
jgi:hypothetical protein